MKHRVRFTRRGWAQVDRASIWWRKHRDKAPHALDEDVDEALNVLRTTPNVGLVIRGHGARALARTDRLLLYYRILDDGTVGILRFWHASRGSRPKLSAAALTSVGV